jgi:hypothetical protein
MSYLTANVNPETGIRYGVTSCIPDWIFYEAMSWDCPAEEEAAQDYARERLTELAESGELDPDDIDGFTFDSELTAESLKDDLREYISSLDGQKAIDCLEAIECDAMQSFFDGCDFSESARYGEIDGVSLMLSSLGGAPLLWIFQSPYMDTVRLCSPCVPNAGDLDTPDGQGFQCYAPSPEWYGEEESGMFE